MSSGEWVRAFAPATVANVACGFDLCGFALETPGDEVAVRASSTPGVRLIEITGDGGSLPMDPERNTATVAARALLDAVGEGAPRGLELRLHKGIASASGIGSSAASAAAAATATAHLLPEPPPPATLLRASMEGERIASGVAHADNVAPALTGGFVLVRPGPRVTPLAAPEELICALIHPHTQVDTRSARAVLPERIAVEDAVVQAGNCAALVAGLLNADYELIASALYDRIAEPYRAALTPGFLAVKQAALHVGALGCSLSGSGPSIFALCRGRDQAERTAGHMAAVMAAETGLASDVVVSSLRAPGARLRG